jgi:oligopeptidase B
LLLKTEMEVGHFGKSGRYEHLKETAFNYAFLLKVLPPAPERAR